MVESKKINCGESSREKGFLGEHKLKLKFQRYYCKKHGESFMLHEEGTCIRCGGDCYSADGKEFCRATATECLNKYFFCKDCYDDFLLPETPCGNLTDDN